MVTISVKKWTCPEDKRTGLIPLFKEDSESHLKLHRFSPRVSIQSRDGRKIIETWWNAQVRKLSTETMQLISPCCPNKAPQAVWCGPFIDWPFINTIMSRPSIVSLLPPVCLCYKKKCKYFYKLGHFMLD